MEKTRVDSSRPFPATGEPDPRPDLKQVGPFRILRRLGEGGMGSVYLGYGEREGQVAIKVLSPLLAGNKDYVDRFYREATTGKQLNHPNIVHGIRADRDRKTGRHFFVMEYVDGPSAHALLDQHGPLALGDALHVILDVARALEHAHTRNIVHRDIKPDNILMTRSGVAKLADLGLAKCLDESSNLTATRQGFGTPHYMPYEQAVNARKADARCDIYALGATLYHLLTGEVPFPGDNPLEVVERKDRGDYIPASELAAGVPAEIDRILARMLARDPEERYQTVSELIVDLERTRLVADVPTFADPALALLDPAIGSRTAVEPTRPDMGVRAAPSTAADARPLASAWQIEYRNRAGRVVRVRLSAETVRQRLSDGRLPPEALACAPGESVLLPLSEIPQFRDLLPPALMASKPTSRENSPRQAPRISPAPTVVLPAPSPSFWLTGASLGALGVIVGYLAIRAFWPG